MGPGTYEGDSYTLLQQRGHAVERLTAEEITKQFPAWSPGVYADGYFNPQGGWAESGLVVEALLDTCRRAGVEVQQGVNAHDVLRNGEHIEGIVTDRGEMRAGMVVLAMGAWTTGILVELSGHIWPVAQPVFHFQAPEIAAYQPPEFPVWTADVSRTGWYGFPALDDGTLKISNHGPGSRVKPSSGVDVAERREEHFRAFLDRSLPGLAQALVLNTRTCYYADSWDGDFYITSVPGLERLFIACGGSGHAFKFAPLLGDWIADAVEGRRNPALERFSWREPGGRQTEDARNL
jgi:glycine/D-amino acid oxidase-like deaminating enzyme